VALYGLAFGINYLHLTRLAKSRFQRTYVNRLLAALGAVGSTWDLGLLYLLLSTGLS